MEFELPARDFLQIHTKISLQAVLKTEIKIVKFLVGPPYLKSAQLKCWCDYSHLWTPQELFLYMYVCAYRERPQCTNQTMNSETFPFLL